MKIFLAKNIGFCSGARRAIRIAKKSLEEDPKPVQFLGPIIHQESELQKIKFFKTQ